MEFASFFFFFFCVSFICGLPLKIAKCFFVFGAVFRLHSGLVPCQKMQDALVAAPHYFPSSPEALIRLHHLALVVITAADLVTAASLFAGSSPEPGGGAVQVINARSEERIINKQTKRPFAASGSRRLLPSAICSGLILLLATLCCHQGDEMTQRDGQLVYLCTCLSCD